jgi:hypothetical protein
VTIDRLTDAQLVPFDRDIVTNDRWQMIRSCIDRDFPSGEFSFVDVGGGNGRFADRVLLNYALATGAVLDTSSFLLSKNVPSPRKRLICANAGELAQQVDPVDIIFCHWVLHHLVSSTSYSQSRANISHALVGIRSALTHRGRVSVYESNYDGYIDPVPGRLIFALTSLKLAAPLVRKLGANTAGVGVCFLSRRQWHDTFGDAGFSISDYKVGKPWKPPLSRKIGLLIKEVRDDHYWLS